MAIEIGDQWENASEQRLSMIVELVQTGNWSDLASTLSDWQISELKTVGKSIHGLQCLLNSWLHQPPEYEEGDYCTASWDNVYCWPSTPVGETVTRSCQETLEQAEPSFAINAEGNAYRVCLENATWLWGNWTNYNECVDSYQEFVRTTQEEQELMVRSQYILFIGSILSIAFLLPAVIIFQHFRCLRCDRVNILKQLMMAMLLRYLLLMVITDPIIFSSSINYRTVDFICKAVLSTYIYATLASLYWMFVQGVYINGKLTSHIFYSQAPFKFYYSIGWGFPLVIVTTYVAIMEVNHPIKCWTGYSKMPEIWIVALPIALILFVCQVNLLLLINIVRTLMKTVRSRALSSDAGHTRRVAISMVFLVPLLGVSNLLFVYNPGGSFHKYYIAANALLGSTQGIFVAVGYCFLSKDVQQAIKRSYNRFWTRLNARRSCSTVHTVRRRNRRLARDVVGHGGPVADVRRSGPPNFAGPPAGGLGRNVHRNCQSNKIQSHLDMIGSHVDSLNPLQNRMVEKANPNATTALSLSSSASNQFGRADMNKNKHCEASGEHIFLEGSEYGEGRDKLKISDKTLKAMTRPSRKLKRSQSYV